MAQTDSLIVAENLSVIRQGSRLLDKISLTLGAHEFITIIGPNGAGKTLLLHALMGILKADEGEVTCRAGLKIGYVPQRLVPDTAMPMTVRRFLKLVKGVVEADLFEAVSLTDIGAILERPLYALSGGELQRVLLARAILNRPDVLVLDEPAQNLDISGELAFYKLLQDIYAARKLSVLMVSHDLHMVMSLTNRVICLYHHICCSGKPAELAQDPVFIEMFGRDMAKMMSVYNHLHNHSHEEHVHDHTCNHNHDYEEDEHDTTSPLGSRHA
ncbi:MAG: metal ABC transporter ATP-binding protein [Proteobacteria bacterium]|nr:metal ABC transporter ATP-binding protein [Pseudomonadota bacterium]